MATKQQTSSAFKTAAAVLAVLLIVAAGLVYLQGTAGGTAQSPALAALSQGIPLHAASAITTGQDGFDRLAQDLEELRSERRRASLPGSRSDWDALERHASALLERRASLQAVAAATRELGSSLPGLLAAADELMGASGATSIIQQFQQRALSLQQALQALAMSADPRQAAAAIAADLAFLRQVTDGLAGETTPLDIAPVDETTREVTLVPMASDLAIVEERVNEALGRVDGIGNVAADLGGLNSAAAALYGSSFGAGAGSALPALLAAPIIPVGLLVIALLIVGILFALHTRMAVFEQTARVQAEQNDRNQQAILRLLDELGSLADGDLTVEATVTEDITGAIADSINYAIEKLRELVATINETAIMVDSAAKQTENTAAHMAKAADHQKREISAASESIVSMASSIEEVSGNAERSSDVARHSVEVAHKGGEAVRRTIDGMNTIRETIQDTSKRIKRLGESSQEIGNIVELINDIAEQTNILALNASIQASMAGEAGRGFAVVADEVQRLAERSTNATKQIEVLVRTIQADTNEAVVSMERSTTDVVGGALLAENAGAALDEIEQVSNQIASLVQNISESARQQAKAAADVTRRTTRLKEFSDQTGKATTATAASISKLSVLASQLRQTVAGFTLPSAALQTSALVGRRNGATPVRAVGGKAAS
ncbi:MAG: methyl-accepting chemotaxis protein [Gammaproteobacteria bacterium]|nr:methyl-accepting chemotaxis protein [Gammaproteobacteria bacterium]MDH4254382.1 methyl-accepting chemotaxis protein [Gammaproteobacteria bacterium]MDH5309315.1 methyl-accepting chemotaxis protein [Gammaproteobacteria bacterium]